MLQLPFLGAQSCKNLAHTNLALMVVSPVLICPRTWGLPLGGAKLWHSQAKFIAKYRKINKTESKFVQPPHFRTMTLCHRLLTVCLQ